MVHTIPLLSFGSPRPSNVIGQRGGAAAFERGFGGLRPPMSQPDPRGAKRPIGRTTLVEPGVRGAAPPDVTA
ncbi:hypothetical protein GCM10020220_048540 [Nonomuraea rubra]